MAPDTEIIRPSIDHLAPILAQRDELLARLARIEAENAKLQRKLERGPLAALFATPQGVLAIVLSIILGGLTGAWTAASGVKAPNAAWNVF